MKSNYQKLISEIFEPLGVLESDCKCIDESEFVILLPGLLETGRPVWTGERLAKLIIDKCGLAGSDRHTFAKIAADYNVSNTAIRNQYVRSLRILGRIHNQITVKQDGDKEESCTSS